MNNSKDLEKYKRCHCWGCELTTDYCITLHTFDYTTDRDEWVQQRPMMRKAVDMHEYYTLLVRVFFEKDEDDFKD